MEEVEVSVFFNKSVRWSNSIWISPSEPFGPCNTSDNFQKMTICQLHQLYAAKPGVRKGESWPNLNCQAIFYHFLRNYFRNVSCAIPLYDDRIFTPPLSVAIWKSYDHIYLRMWLVDTSQQTLRRSMTVVWASNQDVPQWLKNSSWTF